MTMESVLDEIERRKDRERAKALEKYGAIALLPGGHPDYDILDYIINEVVGLERYGSMVRARFPQHVSCQVMGETLQELSATIAPALVALRHHLLLHGEVLGTPEASEE